MSRSSSHVLNPTGLCDAVYDGMSSCYALSSQEPKGNAVLDILYRAHVVAILD